MEPFPYAHLPKMTDYRRALHEDYDERRERVDMMVHRITGKILEDVFQSSNSGMQIDTSLGFSRFGVAYRMVSGMVRWLYDSQFGGNDQAIDQMIEAGIELKVLDEELRSRPGLIEAERMRAERMEKWENGADRSPGVHYDDGSVRCGDKVVAGGPDSLAAQVVQQMMLVPGLEDKVEAEVEIKKKKAKGPRNQWTKYVYQPSKHDPHAPGTLSSRYWIACTEALEGKGRNYLTHAEVREACQGIGSGEVCFLHMAKMGSLMPGMAP